jgi:hypothetical protein
MTTESSKHARPRKEIGPAEPPSNYLPGAVQGAKAPRLDEEEED